MVSEEADPALVGVLDLEEVLLLSEPRIRVSELRRATVERQYRLATLFMKRSAAPRMSRNAQRSTRMCATPCLSRS